MPYNAFNPALANGLRPPPRGSLLKPRRKAYLMGCEDHPEKCPRGKPQNGPVPPGDVGWGNQTLGTRLRELLAGGIRPLPPSCGWQRSVRYRLRRLRSPRTQPSPQVQPCLPQGPPKAPKVPKATKAPKVPEAPKAPKNRGSYPCLVSGPETNEKLPRPYILYTYIVLRLGCLGSTKLSGL